VTFPGLGRTERGAVLGRRARRAGAHLTASVPGGSLCIAGKYSGCSRAGKSPIPDQDSESSIRKPVRIGIPYSSVDQFLHVNDVPAERRCAAAHGRERGRERGRHPRPAQALLGLWSTHGIFLRRRGRTVLSTVHVPGGGVGAAAAHAAVYGVRRAAPRRVSLVS
jgi:hypothetical protein